MIIICVLMHLFEYILFFQQQCVICLLQTSMPFYTIPSLGNIFTGNWSRFCVIKRCCECTIKTGKEEKEEENVRCQHYIFTTFVLVVVVFTQFCFSCRCHDQCSRKRFTRKFKVEKYLLTENLLILLFQRLKKNYQRWVVCSNITFKKYW